MKDKYIYILLTIFIITGFLDAAYDDTYTTVFIAVSVLLFKGFKDFTDYRRVG